MTVGPHSASYKSLLICPAASHRRCSPGRHRARKRRSGDRLRRLRSKGERRVKRLLTIALCFLIISVVAAAAEPYPSRPISIIVPFPAGGPTDTLGRVLADRMKRTLGQNVIIENPTGAAGTIGTTKVARATPDGYTLILGHWQTHLVNGATFNLPFDVVSDFAPISLIADCPVWLVGKEALAPKNLKELIAWLKQNPGGATLGIGGVGGGADVVGSYFQKNTGTKFQFVPSAHQHRDAPFPLWPLCPCCERPCGDYSAGERDELASLHSITSSARASNVGGMVKSSALAAVRLISSSNLVGNSIGKSPGLAPLRILSTKLAVRRQLSRRFVP